MGGRVGEDVGDDVGLAVIAASHLSLSQFLLTQSLHRDAHNKVPCRVKSQAKREKRCDIVS